MCRGSTQNCIMGIVRCIMGNPFCSTTDLQVPSVCTSFVEVGIYWEKNKEDRLVYSFLVKLEHYCECLMWLRPTWRRKKQTLLNSTWKIVKVDCWSSLCWSLICPPPRINRGNHLFTQKWKLTVDPLCINCWSAPPQDQQRQSPFHAKVKADCWSSPCLSLISSLNNQNLNFTLSFQGILRLHMCYG